MSPRTVAEAGRTPVRPRSSHVSNVNFGGTSQEWVKHFFRTNMLRIFSLETLRREQVSQDRKVADQKRARQPSQHPPSRTDLSQVLLSRIEINNPRYVGYQRPHALGNFKDLEALKNKLWPFVQFTMANNKVPDI